MRAGIPCGDSDPFVCFRTRGRRGRGGRGGDEADREELGDVRPLEVDVDTLRYVSIFLFLIHAYTVDLFTPNSRATSSGT
jgi:hypothetical protein